MCVDSLRRVPDDEDCAPTRELMVALAAPCPVGENDLGGDWDRRVGAAVAALRDADPIVVHAAAAEISRGAQAWALLGWAERAGSLALRQRRPRVLEDAALAIVLVDNGIIDTRDIWIAVSLLKVAARRLRVPFPDCVRAALSVAGVGLADERRLFTTASDRLPSTHRMVGRWPRRTFQRNMVDFDADDLMRRLQQSGE